MKQEILDEIENALSSQRDETADVLISYSVPAHIAGDLSAGQILKISTDWNLVQEAALKASSAYGELLKKEGSIRVPKVKKIERAGKEIEIFDGYEKVAFLADAEKEEREKILAIIQTGIEEGKPTGYKEFEKGGGYPKGSIAADLNDYFTERKGHASLVARTETARLQGEGMITRFKASGTNFGRWRTVGDSRVRPEHTDREMAGIQPIEQIPHIGEPGCRCTIQPVSDMDAAAAGFEIPKPE